MLGALLLRLHDARSAASTPAGRSTRPYCSRLARRAGRVIRRRSGVFILGFSSILTGLNFLATIHKLRAAGHDAGSGCRSSSGRSTRPRSSRCSRRRCSAITLLLLTVERFARHRHLRPALGGDPVLFQHFFWFYSHPAVYIMIVPGMGVVSELIATFSPQAAVRLPVRRVLSSVSLALLGFLVWGHHMFVAGHERATRTMVFSRADVPRRHPVGDQGLQLGRHALQGRHPAHSRRCSGRCRSSSSSRSAASPACSSACSSVDVHLHDTYFVVAHFHYVMMGWTRDRASSAASTTGGRSSPARCTTRRSARVGWLGVFFGFNLTFFTAVRAWARAACRVATATTSRSTRSSTSSRRSARSSSASRSSSRVMFARWLASRTASRRRATRGAPARSSGRPRRRRRSTTSRSRRSSTSSTTTTTSSRSSRTCWERHAPIEDSSHAATRTQLARSRRQHGRRSHGPAHGEGEGASRSSALEGRGSRRAETRQEPSRAQGKPLESIAADRGRSRQGRRRCRREARRSRSALDAQEDK